MDIWVHRGCHFLCIGKIEFVNHLFNVCTLIDGYGSRFLVTSYLEAQKPFDRSVISYVPIVFDLCFEFFSIDLSFRGNCHIVHSNCDYGMLVSFLFVENRMINLRSLEV